MKHFKIQHYSTKFYFAKVHIFSLLQYIKFLPKNIKYSCYSNLLKGGQLWH